MTGGERRLPPAVAAGERRIAVYEWTPEGSSRAVIQILHGLAEHAARYERFAHAAAGRGFTVIAHDHRGHGPAYAPDRLGHFADTDGWNRVLDDVDAVRQAAKAAYPDLPLLLFGHSMGSYVAQSLVMRQPHAVDALLLSGSTWPNRLELRVARAVAWTIARLRGPRSPARLMNRLSFGSFNHRFRPNRSEFDWLSRDPDEVDAYVEDPLCGAVSSNRLWVDLLGGLLEISDPAAVARLPDDLPVLIAGGELDPVGGKKALEKLTATWRAAGKHKVTLKLYPQARHEILNETNREEVTDDVLGWIESLLQKERAP